MRSYEGQELLEFKFSRSCHEVDCFNGANWAEPHSIVSSWQFTFDASFISKCSTKHRPIQNPRGHSMIPELRISEWGKGIFSSQKAASRRMVSFVSKQG